MFERSHRFTEGVAVERAAYDAWYNSPRGQWIGQTEYRLLCKELGLPAQGHLLDVGCGTGWFTRQLATLPGLDVTGLDRDAESLAFARAHDPRTRYVQADALALPFADAAFDYVQSVAALCFTADWQRAVTEIVRVTRRRFAIGMLNRHSLLWRDKGQNGGSGAYRGAHWLTPDEFRAGFDGLAVNGLRLRSAIHLPSGSGCARLVEKLLPDSVPWGSLMVVSGEKG